MKHTYGTNYIVITPYGEITAIEQHAGVRLLDMLYDTIGCDLIEVVHISICDKPYIMIVDEEGWCKPTAIVNRIATSLTSDCPLDMSMIAGYAVIGLEGIDEHGEPDICGLTDKETITVLDAIRAMQ